ncbi:MAG TPA: geranylgeranyl reductase family protein [Gammaproteobacteria bacterium]|jgi:geranylgeranyl reductase family protein
MQHYDVLIVGGGPAGSSCAWRLRNSGLDVAILDKAHFPRDKVCAGWVTPAVMHMLQIDLENYAERHVLQPITGFRTSMMEQPSVDTDYTEIVSYGIRRCEFDNYLLRRCGARLHMNEALDTLERGSNGWVINGQYHATLLIGAGGHFCPVVRALDSKRTDGESVVAAREIEFQMSARQMQQCNVNSQIPELFFCKDLTGYGWIFRKGEYLNIGLGREDKHHLPAHLDAFFEFLKSRGKVPPDIDEKFKGHAYLLYGHTPRRMIGERVMFIGDAAGLAYPQSGEGIRPAVESGILAAETILQLQGDYSLKALKTYEAKIIERYGPRSETRKSKRGLLPPALKQRVAARLMRSRWFARHFIINRWFLHKQQSNLTISN